MAQARFCNRFTYNLKAICICFRGNRILYCIQRHGDGYYIIYIILYNSQISKESFFSSSSLPRLSASPQQLSSQTMTQTAHKLALRRTLASLLQTLRSKKTRTGGTTKLKMASRLMSRVVRYVLLDRNVSLPQFSLNRFYYCLNYTIQINIILSLPNPFI